MTSYTSIHNSQQLYSVIMQELQRDDINFSGTIGILLEGNSQGDMEISLVTPDDIDISTERKDMEGYGWVFCESKEDIRSLAENYFGD